MDKRMEEKKKTSAVTPCCQAVGMSVGGVGGGGEYFKFIPQKKI
jgi:hypothetical protein